jgi:flavin-dependent dehydrogenase
MTNVRPPIRASHTRDVIVVGAGPAGSAVAHALASAGRDVVAFDRARFPRPKPCAEYVSPEATAMLASIGVLEPAMRAGAVRLSGMRVRSPDGSELTGEWAAARRFRGSQTHGIALRRDRLDALLVDAARTAGAEIREGECVRNLVRDERGRVVGVTLADGTEQRAHLVIGADGLRSIVARRLRVGRAAHWPRRVAFVSHYRGVEGVTTHGEMHVERDGYVGLAPVDGGLVNVAAVVPARRARSAAGDAATFLERWVVSRPHLATRFANAERVAPVLATGPFGWRTRRAWSPGAALLGDAADFFDPFTGEGIFAALRGAELLAPYADAACTAKTARDADDALASYERDRRAAFRGKWRVERLVGFTVGWPALMNRVARGLARRRDLADTLVGVTGDVVPADAVLRPAYALALALAAFARGT